MFIRSFVLSTVPTVFGQYHFLSFKLLCYTRISSPEKSRNNTRGKNIVSVALVMAFLATESENRQLENLLQADFG